MCVCMFVYVCVYYVTRWCSSTFFDTQLFVEQRVTGLPHEMVLNDLNWTDTESRVPGDDSEMCIWLMGIPRLITEYKTNTQLDAYLGYTYIHTILYWHIYLHALPHKRRHIRSISWLSAQCHYLWRTEFERTAQCFVCSPEKYTRTHFSLPLLRLLIEYVF